jgi:hypothetical protein
MSRLIFNHTSRTEAAMTAAFDRPWQETVREGGARNASPALVRSRI